MLFVAQMNIIFAISTSNYPIITKFMYERGDVPQLDIYLTYLTLPWRSRNWKATWPGVPASRRALIQSYASSVESWYDVHEVCPVRVKFGFELERGRG